jgi:hypothetical protein
MIHPRYLLELLHPFRDFFDHRNLPLPRRSVNPKLDYDTLAKIIATPDIDTPKDLADALYFIHELSTVEGMEALLEGGDLDRFGEIDGMFSYRTPADVAILAWLKDRRWVERKHAELRITEVRRFDYFQMSRLPPPSFEAPGADQIVNLEAALELPFAKRGRGHGVHIFCCPHKHDYLFVIRHGDPFRREGAMEGTKASSVFYRPLCYDAVGYDSRTGTLRVHAKHRWESQLYRHQFGLQLFGAIDAFPDIGRYALEPIRAQKAACLECKDIKGLKHVTLLEVHIAWGGSYGEVEIRRASDLYAAMRQRHWDFPPDVPLVRATFLIEFYGSGGRRTVTLEPPNAAHYSRDEDSMLIDQWLLARGFIHPIQGEGDAQSKLFVESA